MYLKKGMSQLIVRLSIYHGLSWPLHIQGIGRSRIQTHGTVRAHHRITIVERSLRCWHLPTVRKTGIVMYKWRLEFLNVERHAIEILVVWQAPNISVSYQTIKTEQSKP